MRKELRSQIQNRLVELRNRTKLEHLAHTENREQSSNVQFTRSRMGWLHGQNVARLVLMLKSTGCEWTTKGGGCTFCGFWNETNLGLKISDDEYVTQVLEGIEDDSVDLDQYPVICLYNKGSMLKQGEISFSAVLRICKLLTERTQVKKIVLEAMLRDITEEKVAALAEIMGSTELEIAVGFESANELVRDLCINKMFGDQLLASKCQIAKRHKVSLVPYVMLKPPFLTESQAIHDVLSTFRYLEQFRLQRIDLEIGTVERNTLMHELWKHNLYSPPRLWSVIEILTSRQRLGLTTPVFVSPVDYQGSDSSLARPSNCPKCSEAVGNAIIEYDKSLDVNTLHLPLCACKEDWKQALRYPAAEDFVTVEQISGIMEELHRREAASEQSHLT